jgi:hypothetical protein
MLFLSVFALLMSSAFAKVEVSCTVFLYGENDWLINPKTHTSNCLNEVLRVRNYCGGSKLNFVVTQFWFDNNGDMMPNGFGTKNGYNYVAINPTKINAFRSSMTTCIRYAINQKFTTLAVTPHLDDGSGKGGWRNALVMNPLQRYGGKYSYYDIMIKPMVDALKGAIGNNKNIHIYFSMQGEMNLMLWKYPVEWLRMAKAVKFMLPNNAKTGISVNFNKLCGNEYCNNKNVQNVANSQKLVKSVDFIGLSAYPSVPVTVHGDDFLNSANALANEFKSLGVDLRQVARSGVEIVFSEFGIGGANCQKKPARIPKDAVSCPFYGVFGTYKGVNDPWKSPVMKNFIKMYYGNLVKWAKAGTGSGNNFKISQIYIWNVASWDVTGIYHDSYSRDGSYKSQDVVNILKNWNDKNIVPK